MTRVTKDPLGPVAKVVGRRLPTRAAAVPAGLGLLVGLAIGWFLGNRGAGGEDPTEETAEPAPETVAVAPNRAIPDLNAAAPEREWTPEEQEVVDAYIAGQQASMEAYAPLRVNPGHPGLEETHTEETLDGIVSDLESYRRLGIARQYPEDSVAAVDVYSVTFESDDLAVLEACSIVDAQRVVLATGEVIPGWPEVQRADSPEAMHREDGRWKLAATDDLLPRSDGGAECALASGGSR